MQSWFHLSVAILILVFLTPNDVVAGQPLDVGSGTEINLGGSTTLYQPFEEIIRRYSRHNSDITFINSASSSGRGISLLISGAIDVALSSRPLNGNEYASAMGTGVLIRELNIGNDGVVIIVHPKKYRYLKKLSLLQLRKLFFNGSIRDWQQLDKQLRGKVTVYVRDSTDSGTAEFFARKVAGDSQVPFVLGAHHVRETTLLLKAVSEDENGIAFLPAPLVDESVRVLNIVVDDKNDIAYSLAAIRKGVYPLMRPLYLVIREDQNPLVARFVAYVRKPEAMKILHRYEIEPAL